LEEDLCGLGVMVFWGLVWLGMVGVNLASLITTSAVITAVIAFAMQDTLGNILGGIVLQLDGSMRVGDWVDVDGVRGRVSDVRWRFTAIETRNRETVYVPNSLLMKNRFMVMGSRSDPEMRWRRWVWFSVEAAAPPTRVCEVLQRAVIDAEIPLVARDPTRLGALVFALQNLEAADDPNVMQRVGQRLLTLPLADYSRQLLANLLARAVPGEGGAGKGG
jgi:small-conductance mechanosensitive channel